MTEARPVDPLFFRNIDPQVEQEYKKNRKIKPNGHATGVSLDEFYAYMPDHNYIYVPTGEMWPAASINARIPPIFTGLDEKRKEKFISPSAWLDQYKPVEQMTWAPGLPLIIPNQLISLGGWIPKDGVNCFNLYRPPIVRPGDPNLAGPWIEHVCKMFPDDAAHIIAYMAHRVQRPEEKTNHALVLSGNPGIGKDSILVPVRYAIGPWNFREASPAQVLGRFNHFLKGVILRISEARDLGDFDRYQFYEHMKGYTAAPPETLTIDEKFLRECSILNCVGIIITTNYKAEGIYLPPDDRRHYVAWSNLVKENFNESYWSKLHGWYECGGNEHVAAYLTTYELSGFNPKAPPLRTTAFWEIVDASRAPEDAELADILDSLGKPDIVTVKQVVNAAVDESFKTWLQDRKNSRRIPHRLEACGYVAVRNEAANDGLWVIYGKRQVIYVKQSMTPRDRIAAAIKATQAR
jgi:hypothetical protein